MMLHYCKELSSLSDVKEFFGWLADEGVNFHPEDSFKNMATLSADEADELDELMDQAWSICERENVDICEVACEVTWPKVFGREYAKED